MRIEQPPHRFGRALRFERLEDRRVLAVFTVSNLSDGPVAFPGAAPGTLRQAIYDANHTPGADTIEFAATLQGTINLSIADDNSVGASALLVSSTITIHGNAKGITIARNSAVDAMRLFYVTSTGDLDLDSVSVTGGVVRGANGVAAGEVGGEGRGGAIYNQGTLRIVSSTLYGNQATGGNGGSGASSGSGRGGAIYSDGGSVIVTDATISGSIAQSGVGSTVPSSFGGAIYVRNGSLDIYNSTITDSTASTGRGVYLIAQQNGSASADIWSSIIAQSDAPIQARDFLTAADDGSQLTVTGGNNLIRTQGDYQFITVSTDDPLLAPLGDNGGPTWTHGLLAGSPALNLGSNPQNLAVDQRGASYARVVGGAADIGAVEMQSVTGTPHTGDYNANHVVDAADYVLWRATLGASVAAHSGADGDGSGKVDAADYGVWRSNFGLTGGAGASSSPDVDLIAASPASPTTLVRLPVTPVAMGSSHNKALAANALSGDAVRSKDLAILDLVTRPGPTIATQYNSLAAASEEELSRSHTRGERFHDAIWKAWSSVSDACSSEFSD